MKYIVIENIRMYESFKEKQQYSPNLALKTWEFGIKENPFGIQNVYDSYSISISQKA